MSFGDALGGDAGRKVSNALPHLSVCVGGNCGARADLRRAALGAPNIQLRPTKRTLGIR